MAIQVNLVGATGSRSAELTDDVEVAQLIPQIIRWLNVTNADSADYPITYHLRHRNRRLQKDETLASAKVQAGDTLIIETEVAAAGWPELLTIAASAASIAQLVLMIADMWSKKASRKKVNKTSNANNATEKANKWNEVKEIRILMSDGNWVQFSSWLAEPDKLKNFLDIFHHPSASPNPLFVEFILESGSKFQLVISDDPVHRQQLDDFINIIRL